MSFHLFAWWLYCGATLLHHLLFECRGTITAADWSQKTEKGKSKLHPRAYSAADVTSELFFRLRKSDAGCDFDSALDSLQALFVKGSQGISGLGLDNSQCPVPGHSNAPSGHRGLLGSRGVSQGVGRQRAGVLLDESSLEMFRVRGGLRNGAGGVAAKIPRYNQMALGYRCSLFARKFGNDTVEAVLSLFHSQGSRNILEWH